MVSNEFARYRERFFVLALISALIIGYIVKAVIMFAAESQVTIYTYFENLPGFALTTYANNASWNLVATPLVVALIAVLVTVVGLYFFQRRIRLKPLTHLGGANKPLRNEFYLYVFVFLCVAPLITVSVGMETFLFMHVAPLLMLNLANPLWGENYRKSRLFIFALIFFASYLSITSKTTVVYALIALGLGPLYLKRGRLLISVLSVALLIFYPYLNIFRGMASDLTAIPAVLELGLRLSSDLGSNTPMIMFVQNSIGMIMDRITGLDGVIVSLTLGEIDISSSVAFSQALTGVEGKGISPGLLGKLNLQVGDIFIASAIYPFIVLSLVWVMTSLNKIFWNLGLLSMQPYLAFEVIQMLVGGFRMVDVKLTCTLLLVITLCFTLQRYLFLAFPVRRLTP